MPETPPVGLVTRWILENPYPLAGVLALAALVAVVSGLRQGLRGRIVAAGVLAALAALVLGCGLLVVTSGEQGRRTTRQFVDAVVGSDIVAAEKLLAGDASLALGSPRNPGFDRSFMVDQMDRFSRRYTIKSNRVTMLRGYGRSPDEAEVHLACITEDESGYGPTVTRWVVVVRREDDGTWRIGRLVWISANGREVSQGMMR